MSRCWAAPLAIGSLADDYTSGPLPDYYIDYLISERVRPEFANDVIYRVDRRTVQLPPLQAFSPTMISSSVNRKPGSWCLQSPMRFAAARR